MDEPRSSPRFPLWETIAIFLALASLWPAYILDLPGPYWRILSYVMLGLMAAIFVRRMIVFHRLAREAEQERQKKLAEGKQGRDRLPWEP
jgi:hypothetical protein